jgi:hypothetical protein
MEKLISRLQVMKLHATVIAESRFFPRGCGTNHNLPLRRKFSVSEMQPGCIITERHRDRLALYQKSLRHRESFSNSTRKFMLLNSQNNLRAEISRTVWLFLPCYQQGGAKITCQDKQRTTTAYLR